MTCTPFQIGGIRGIVCHRTRRPRYACGQPATLQCDAPTKRRSGTCDRHICEACATEFGPDRHLCARHAQQPATMLISATSDVGQENQQVAPVQGGLF